MTVNVGPTNWWWYSSPNSPINCHVKSAVRLCGIGASLRDGSRIICVGVSSALIVSPACTQVTSAWAGGQYNTTLVGDKCCISEWSTLNTRLIQCGFNPVDWCVPSQPDLSVGYTNRNYWDSFTSCGAYWSSTEANSICALNVCFTNGGVPTLCKCSGGVQLARAFRRVSY